MKFLENIPLASKTWFRTGGNAKFYCEPENENDFVAAISFAKEKHLEIFVLGSGANILISDAGFKGLVMKPMNTNLVINETESILAGAGVEMDELINYCLNHNLLGLEEFSGIPGTVGGSVYINLHYFEFYLSNFITSAKVINFDDLKIQEVGIDWFEYGYDRSKLMDKKHFLIECEFKVKPSSDLEAAFAKGRKVEIIRHRNNKYPTQRTCGSFFANFDPKDITLEINGRKMIFTAYYLDQLGIKGTLKSGKAFVSSKHANMIETMEGATSQDVINLAREMQRLVKEKYGILPQPECQLVGFDEYPLFQVN